MARQKITTKDLKNFGIVLGIFLVALAAMFFWRGRNYWPAVASSGVVIFCAAIIFPNVLFWPYKFLQKFGKAMGWLVTRVVLIIFFYLVVTPIGLVLKIFGKRLLETGFRKDKKSYWNPREAQKESKNFEMQF